MDDNTSAIEDFVGSMSLSQLCDAAGISVATLLQRVGFFGAGVSEAPRATRVAHASRSKNALGSLANAGERQLLEASIREVLLAEPTGTEMNAAALHERLPWTNLTRDQLTKTLRRLGEIGSVEISGPVTMRLYKIGKVVAD